VAEARKASEEAEDGEGGRADGEVGKPGGSRRASSASDSADEDSPTGALASDEALAALRDKLSGGQN
jgi:small subunit ribosomal protein S1